MLRSFIGALKQLPLALLCGVGFNASAKGIVRLRLVALSIWIVVLTVRIEVAGCRVACNLFMIFFKQFEFPQATFLVAFYLLSIVESLSAGKWLGLEMPF